MLSVVVPDEVDPNDVYWLFDNDTLFGDVQMNLGPGSYLAFIPGCPAVGEVLPEPFPFFISSTIEQLPTCDDPCSGVVSIVPNFGQGEITYSWSHNGAESGPVGTGICEQTVLVSALDENGCSDQDIITVEIPPVEALAFGTDPSCNGFDDGTVSAVATGGLGGGFTFTWEDAQGAALGDGADLSGLVAGVYVVTATDTGGCEASQSVLLDNPPPVNVTMASEPVSCFGEEDGAASAMFDGATNYAWSGPGGFSASGADLDSLTGLAPGTYEATVVALDGCVGLGSVVVIEPAPLDAAPFVSPPLCPGDTNGTAGLVAEGGTAPYSVSWVLPGGGSEEGTFLDNLGAGVYAYELTDASACSLPGSLTVEDPEPVAIELSAVNPSCASGAGSDNGSLEATVSGGLPPYSATWVDVTTFTTVAVGLSASGLAEGVYGFGIADQLGCALDTVVELMAPDSLDIAVSTMEPSCFGAADGQADVAVAGGTPGYSVVWGGDIDPTFGPTLTGLQAGSLTVTVTDDAGCEAMSSVTLDQPEELLVAPASIPVGCSGNDGAVSVMVQGGTPGYDAMWTGPEGPTGEGLTLDGLTPGTYQVEVTDNQGCVALADVVVETLDPLAVTAALSVVDCETGTSALTWTADGGAPPLVVTLEGESGPIDESGWNALSPGDHVLTVTDDRLCTDDTTWTVNAPLELTVTATPAGCGGLGVIEAEATGGNGPVVFDSNGLGEGSPIAEGTVEWTSLEPGTYAIDVSDGTCAVVSEVEVQGASLFQWSVGVLDDACEEAPGGISVSIVGAVAPIEFEGTNPDEGITWTALDTLGLPAGTYLLHAEDAAGCSRDTVINLGSLPDLTLAATATPVSCHGLSDGAIELIASGGTAPWVLGAQGPDGLLEAPLQNLDPGVYLTGVVDARGCTADSLVLVEEPAAAEVEVTTTAESCPGIEDGALSLTLSGGTGDWMVEWEGGPMDPDWTGLGAGVYAWNATDAAGCDTSGTAEVTAGQGLQAETNFVLGACDEGQSSGTVTLTLTGPSDAAVLLGGLQADDVETTEGGGVWTWFNLASGSYGWTASAGEGCVAEGNIEVELPPVMQWAGLVTQPLCEGDSGAVVGITTGGSGLIQNAWSGVTSEGDSLQGEGINSGPLPDGTYTFTAVDGAGCQVDTTVTLLPVSSGLSLSMDVIQPSCGGALVGEASLTPAGGVPPYDVIVEGAADSTFLPFLLSGTYPIAVFDSLGCPFLDTLLIEPASAFILEAQVDSASCAGSEDGTIVLNTLNGTGEAAFTFVGPFGAVPVTDTISGVGAGVYEVTALDEAGCPAVILVNVAAPPPVVVTLDSLDRPSCSGDVDGALSVLAYGGQGDPASWLYSWTLNGDALPDESGPSVLNLGEGTYAITVTDEAGCEGDIASIPLLAEGDIELNVPADTTLCAGQTLVLEATAQGASTTLWSAPDSTTGPGLITPPFAAMEGLGLWVFTASRLGCVQTDTVAVLGWPLPQPDAGPDQTVPEGAAAALGTEPNVAWTYSWSPQNAVLTAFSSATMTEPLFTTATFIVEAVTEEGCANTDTVVVEVLQELDIPSGFTPNDDGVNDRWNLGGIEAYPSAEITVFNRWGDVLFTRGSQEDPWDGTINGIPVPVGTYYYHIRVNESALVAEWTGPITLMR